MNSLDVILLSFVLVWTVEVASAKPNLVSQMVDQLLSKFSTENLTIPEVELGQRTNRLSDVVMVMDGLNKTVDGQGNFGFKMTASAPKVRVTGNYDIENLDIPQLFPFFGKGNFSINLESIKMNFTMKATPDFLTEKFIITIPEAKATVGDSAVVFENLLNDSYLADFLNELVSALVPDVFAIVHELLDFAHPVIEYFVNEVITCIKKELLTGKIEECIRNITMPPLDSVFS